MRLPGFLSRLLRRPRPVDSETERYTAAADLEQRTQAHYRSVTGVDASGRTETGKTERGKSDRARGRKK